MKQTPNTATSTFGMLITCLLHIIPILDQGLRFTTHLAKFALQPVCLRLCKSTNKGKS